MKNIHTLINDIYDLVETKEVPEGVDIEDCIEAFGEGVKYKLGYSNNNCLMRHEFTRGKVRHALLKA
jgi:hypothetical protein